MVILHETTLVFMNTTATNSGLPIVYLVRVRRAPNGCWPYT